ncbi:MAG: DNA polymerase/3'-5' exonuclease PolX [Candidatus Omnitrophica bacterium]|nr:DNA polymerase/3'-5' exonuclease PolX [Candidatus Omnitrophota bacterium]
MDKSQVIQILEEFATLLELKSENPFKVRAFQNAARALETHAQDLKSLIESGELEKIKGIGKGISHVIHELYEKGFSQDHKDLRKGFPDSLFDLFRVQGLGAKRIKVLYDKLHIRSLGELEYACKENRLLKLDGFGTKSQENILKGIEYLKKSSGKSLLSSARQESAKLIAYLEKQKGISRIEIAGSLRRSKEIIGDIDILVSAADPVKIHTAFIKYPEVESVLAHGETKSSVALKSGMNCDLRTVTEKEFPFALQYFTGSKEHNVVVRGLAKDKGFKLNEYGMSKGTRLIPCKDEAEIYSKLGLNAIPPEVRENTGEIEWVAKNPFPKLIEEKDIRGIFHVHSDESDGNASLEAMIERAQELGYEYIGISDHSQSAGYAHGLDSARVKDQWKRIDALQKKFKIRIFKGIESDILGDGALDYPEEILKGFDFVIGSIHSKFNLPENEQTRRVIRAIENPYLAFVGHPTGRLLLGREGFHLDMEAVLNAAKENQVVMELNANPHRLDLDWRFCRLAKEKGVKLSINPDAHSLAGLEDVTYGVGIARKGWLERKDVVNTLSATEMEKYLTGRK